VLAHDREAVPLGEVLDRQVAQLLEAHRGGDPVAAEKLRATSAAGAGEEMPGSPLTEEAARIAVALDHGYADWGAARADAGLRVDTRFEAAADAIQWGQLTALRDLLDAHPQLISMRSPFPHHCTLLHHVAANGVEVERQLQSPPNATQVMQLLLDRGADPDAACDLYGGGPNATTLCLLVSSCVPAAAGVQVPLVGVLCRGGAAVNGPEDDGTPLDTAISWGYTGAAEELVRCGARVDDLVSSAALGDLAAVREYFAGGVPAGNLLEHALGAAALHGRRDVVEYLLGKGPDLSFTDPSFGVTARGAASYAGHTQIVALIDERLASS
jgi:hypothetical protein